MERIKQEVVRKLIEAVRNRFGIEIEVPPVLYPPTPDLGDLALPVAFDLAKRLKRPPRALATELASELGGIPGLDRVAVAGGGYLNLYLDREAYALSLLDEVRSPSPSAPTGRKVIIEHTNINPNKAAHIGHLRNAALGDTLARCLRALGRPVEVQNYIDDTGVQVADLAIGVTRLERLDLEGVRRREAELEAEGRPLDHHCWDLYARVTDFYQGREATRDEWRSEALREMEEGVSPLARIAAYLAERIVRRHLATMERIGVRYDLLPRESDILAHRFWERAFSLLKQSGAVSLATAGRNAGCWVMDLSGAPEFAELTEGQKILVRSNGTVTYVGKDIAYQLWKFGLLGSDFEYRPFHGYPDGHLLWTTARGGGENNPPAFGRGETIYNVIDVRQSYLQRIVVEALRLLGHPEEARRSIHFAYEMVALSPACAAEMGLAGGDSDSRPFVEMSGRKGLGVKADDLLDNLVRRADEEVTARHPDLPAERLREAARRIAVGALRYYMLRFTRNKIIAFDFADALSFEGETGPYVQYAVVRAAGILGKVAAAEGMREADVPEWAASARLAYLKDHPGGEEWEMASWLGRLHGTVEQAVANLELSILAKYAFVLAQKFNAFYHKYPVLQETDPDRKRGRALLTYLFRRRMTALLDLMGIPVPPLM